MFLITARETQTNKKIIQGKITVTGLKEKQDDIENERNDKDIVLRSNSAVLSRFSNQLIRTLHLQAYRY